MRLWLIRSQGLRLCRQPTTMMPHSFSDGRTWPSQDAFHCLS